MALVGVERPTVAILANTNAPFVRRRTTDRDVLHTDRHGTGAVQAVSRKSGRCLSTVEIFIHAGVPGIKLRTVDVEGEHQILPEYQAVVGRKAELPCNITVPSHNDKVSLILWYKGESRVPMYSVDARNSALDKAKHFPSEALGSRASFNMLTRPALLKIDPVQEDDSGEYRCRVDFRWARTYTTIALLNVIVPPADITIIDEEGTEVSGVIGPYDEDSDIVLRCEVSGGRPTPVVTWWREYTLLDDSYQVVSDGVVRNDVLIRGLQRSDLMTMLTCQTHNSNITAPIVASVTIDLNLKPLDVRITSIKRPFSAESKVEVVCISGGARPPARITWWKDNDQLMNSTERIPSSGNHTTSILTFWPSGDDNGKYLSCKADNPRLPDSTLEDGWMLNVSFAPRVILTTNGQTHRQAVMEKEDVYLHCEVRANPQVVTVQWLYEGVPIVNNLSQGVIITNQSLVLSKAQRFHRGKYQCLASNIEGQGKSEELFLEINYAPKCRNGQDNLYGAGKDELVRVKCEVEAEPPDVEFHWNFNNTVEKRDLSSFTVDGLQSVVTYIPRKLDDYGTLSCWSRNIAGQQEEPCLFTIILVGPPEKVRNCTITNITSSSLLIECESGHDGGLQQRFHLEVYNSAKERLEANLTNSINPVFHVTSLPSSTSFVLISYASNLKGRSNSITLRAKTLVTYTKQSESFTGLPINPILGVLIGIVAALVFVAGIAVIIMKRRSDDDDKGPLEDSAVEKSQTLLRKDQKDGMESDSKDPDVIPPKSEIADYPSDEEEWQSLQSNNLSGPVYRKPIRDNYGFYEKGIGTNLQKTVKAAKNMRCNDTTAQESLISTSKQPDTQIEFTQWDLQRRRSSIKEQEMMADTPLVNSGITKIIPKHKMKNEHRTLSTPV